MATASAGAAASASAWLWDKYGKDFVDTLGGTTKQQWSKFGWKKAAKNYRDNMRRQYSTIRGLGKSDPVPLEGIFTDAYILDEVTARQRFSIEQLKGLHPDRLQHRQLKREKGLQKII